MKPDLSDSLTAARDLLGWRLVHKSPEGITSGYIVETEAYDMADPASHAYGGMRVRNAPMYESAGMVYVYFIYGVHYCMNIVTGPKGHGQAVLIRALEPIEGIELMKKRRGIENERLLTNGPAKLAQALGIGPRQNGVRLEENGLYLEPGIEVSEVVQTTRIGISKAVDHPWRFYIAGNDFISKP
jgi:DNA-3-methyladenine glycosylase